MFDCDWSSDVCSSDLRGGKNRGKAESRGKDMDEPADEGAEGREHAFALAAGEAAREDVENARAWRDCQEQSSGQEKYQAVRVEHAEIVQNLQGRSKPSSVLDRKSVV